MNWEVVPDEPMLPKGGMRVRVKPRWPAYELIVGRIGTLQAQCTIGQHSEVYVLVDIPGDELPYTFPRWNWQDFLEVIE